MIISSKPFMLEVFLKFLFSSKKSSNHFKTNDTELQLSEAYENVSDVLKVILGIWYNFVSRIYVSKEITHPIFSSL